MWFSILILGLTEEQIERVLDFTILEALDMTDRDLRHSTIKGRVPLLLSCLTTKEKANKAMHYLQVKKLNTSITETESIAKMLLLQIYMKLPQSLINSWQVMKNLDQLVRFIASNKLLKNNHKVALLINFNSF